MVSSQQPGTADDGDLFGGSEDIGGGPALNGFDDV